MLYLLESSPIVQTYGVVENTNLIADDEVDPLSQMRMARTARYIGQNRDLSPFRSQQAIEMQLCGVYIDSELRLGRGRLVPEKPGHPNYMRAVPLYSTTPTFINNGVHGAEIVVPKVVGRYDGKSSHALIVQSETIAQVMRDLFKTLTLGFIPDHLTKYEISFGQQEIGTSESSTYTTIAGLAAIGFDLRRSKIETLLGDDSELQRALVADAVYAKSMCRILGYDGDPVKHLPITAGVARERGRFPSPEILRD